MAETQVQIEKLRTLQESYDAVADAVETQLPALADKIDNIKLPEIDTTELAKEATVSSIKDYLDQMVIASRKIDGVYDVSNGISLTNLMASNLEINKVYKLLDNNTGWISDREDFISKVADLFPNCRYIELGCSEVTSPVLKSTKFNNGTIVFKNIQNFAQTTIVGSSSVSCNGVSVHIYGFKTSSVIALFFVDNIFYHDYEHGTIYIGVSGTFSNKNTKYLYVACKGQKDEQITITSQYTKDTILRDIEIGEGVCQNITLHYCHGLTEENIINHILKKLKQDEEMCGRGVTITLEKENLAKLTSEEAVALLDSLTNTYGYTFA